MENRISAVIITFNEEKNILRCLNSLKNIADEIIIIDSGSTDKTKEICTNFNVNFISQNWLGYGNQKNLGNSFAKYEYILSLDADECLSDELIKNILKVKQQKMKNAYSMNRLTNYCGKWIHHCGWYPDKKIRLFKKESANWANEKVHESLVLDKNTEIEFIQGDLLHYSFYSISDHIKKSVHYAELSAQEMYKNKKSSSIFKIIFRSCFAFFRAYFFRAGFLDGFQGFVICKIIAFSTFLKYAKLRELNQKNP